MSRKQLPLVLRFCMAGIAAFAATPSRAGDWPQILGPGRNGVAVGETLPDKFPAGGPKTLWTHAVGAGYAGPVVAGETVVVFHRQENVERVEALDATSGRLRWKADFRATYRGGIDPDVGPRAAPLIHDGRVYVFGAGADLHCVELATGRKVWSRELAVDPGASEGYFGSASTPIVADGKLLVNLGGRGGAGIAAFALGDGKTLWTATDEDASYSSPTLATIDGDPHVIFVTRLNVVSLDPAGGAVRFRFPFGKRGPSVNAATPLVFEDNLLFVSAAYGVGAVLARITPQGAQTVWANDESLSSQYNTAVYRDGYLYGIDGREDHRNGKLRCVKAATGEVVWSQDDFGVAHLILAGDRLLALNVSGELVIVPATPKGFESLARATVAEEDTRALPALANGRLFFRTSAENRGLLKCVRVANGE